MDYKTQSKRWFFNKISDYLADNLKNSLQFVTPLAVLGVIAYPIFLFPLS